MVISVYPYRLGPFIQCRSSDLCLWPDCSMPSMPDEGGNGTGSIVSSVNEKWSNLIKITLAAMEKNTSVHAVGFFRICNTLSVSAPAALGCWHQSRLLAAHSLVNHPAPSKTRQVFAGRTVNQSG